MGIIAWIVLGAIAGFLANMIVGGREGLIGTIMPSIFAAGRVATGKHARMVVAGCADR